jgi:phospholipase C
MTDYAYRSLARQITITPGEVQTYRLPTMMPGVFHLVATRWTLPPGHHLTPHSAPALPAPNSASPAEALIAQPEDLVLDLFHGDQMVASASNALPLQQTPSEGDDTWRVRMQLGPGSPLEDYTFILSLDPFPSILPILTRRIPLAFYQQGFADNWNGRNYVTIELTDGAAQLFIDPEVASYYNLPLTQQLMLVDSFAVTLPDVVTEATLRVDSSDAGYEGLPGPLPYIELSVQVSGVDGQAMKASLFTDDFTIDPFVINVKFFLTADGPYVGYRSQVATDLLSQLHHITGVIKKRVREHIEAFAAQAESTLDGWSRIFGKAITPWLLGAAFEVTDVSYSGTNSQPVPENGPQGDIVIRYVGQPASASSPGLLMPPTVLTLTPAWIADGVVGEPYTQDFSAVAGVGALTWNLAGELPPGTAFTGDTVSGTPTAAGIYHIEVSVRDSTGAQAAREYTFAVNTPNLEITAPTELPDAVVGLPYAVVLAAPVPSSAIWTASGLPSGLSISPLGVVSGTPSGPSSTDTVVVTVHETSGSTAYRAFSLSVRDPLLFPDPLYVPMGDGDSTWKPAANQATVVHPHGPVGHPTTIGDLHKIDHIIVVMMENRSFDHMLGYLSREGGRTDVDGLRWETAGNRTQFNFYQGRYYHPELLTDTHAFYTEAMSPDHSHESVKAQMADGMMHFVSNYAKNKVGDDPDLLRLVMGYYGAAQLPVYDRLASEFAICDRWFSAHPGPTWPNRFVTLIGDLNRDSYGEPEVDTPLYSDFTPSEATILFDLLTSRGVSWRYFQHRESMIRAFTKYSFDMVNVVEFDDPTRGFLTSLQGGLPSVSFVDPLFGDLPAGVGSPQDNDDAPPSDLKDGQNFINGIVDWVFDPSINSSWLTTMLVIVYDEHGGFYDHVDPPNDAVSLLGQNSGKLGPRVPAFVVSPWTPKGLVLKHTFDHTTLAATILRRFCSPHPPFLSPRVTAARDLRDALPLETPRAQLTPLLGTSRAKQATPTRTIDRRFTTPIAVDANGGFLGGLALTLGATPRAGYVIG